MPTRLAPDPDSPTRYTRRLIIVVPASAQEEMNDRVVEVTGREPDRNTFTSPLSGDGSEPATHYWCNWAMWPGRANSLRGQLTALADNLGVDISIYNGMETTGREALNAEGLQPVQVEAV